MQQNQNHIIQTQIVYIYNTLVQRREIIAYNNFVYVYKPVLRRDTAIVRNCETNHTESVAHGSDRYPDPFSRDKGYLDNLWCYYLDCRGSTGNQKNTLNKRSKDNLISNSTWLLTLRANGVPGCSGRYAYLHVHHYLTFLQSSNAHYVYRALRVAWLFAKAKMYYWRKKNKMTTQRTKI